MSQRNLFLIAICLQINMLIGCTSQSTISPPSTSTPLAIAATATVQSSAPPFEPPVDPATLTMAAPMIIVGTSDVGPALTTIPINQATSTPSAPGETLTLSLSDNGKTITLSVGQEFLLFLDQNEMLWAITIDDQSIVSPVIDIMPIKGSQGLFKANQPGQTTMSAVGDLPCRQSVPPCMAPSILFQIQIIVQ